MIKIDKNKCDQCGTCISVCPGDALVLLHELEINPEKCRTCGQCVRVCPFGALSK